jgi:hypothetical protein
LDLDAEPGVPDHWLVGPFVETLASCGVLTMSLAYVTLTVAEGVALATVGQAFRGRYRGPTMGAWLVPERDSSDRLHYHGLVVTSELDGIVPIWQRCGGGSPYAQDVQALDLGVRANVRRAVAYTMKGASYPFRGVIASGVLTMPWAFACEGQGPDGLDDPAPCERAELRSIPSKLPAAPEIDDDAWVVEIQDWPPDACEAFSERVSVYSRFERGDERQRAYWAYLAVRSLAHRSDVVEHGTPA